MYIYIYLYVWYLPNAQIPRAATFRIRVEFRTAHMMLDACSSHMFYAREQVDCVTEWRCGSSAAHEMLLVGGDAM